MNRRNQPRNPVSLFLTAQKELYRQHLVATIQLAKCIYKYPEEFKGKRVYFCLPLGLVSDTVKQIKHKNRLLTYLELPGGHICAPTFFKLPVKFQANLNYFSLAVKATVNYYILTDNVVEDKLYHIRYSNPIKRGYKGLDAESFCVTAREFSSWLPPRIISDRLKPIHLRRTDYFIGGTKNNKGAKEAFDSEYRYWKAVTDAQPRKRWGWFDE